MKKIIATILTIVMLLSLIPAVFAENVTEGEVASDGVKIVYDIHSILSGKNSLGKNASWASNNIPASDFSYEATKGYFQYVGNSSGKDVVDVSTIKWNEWCLYLSNSAWWAFKIYVPEDGVYTPQVTYGHFAKNGNVLHVSLIKAESVLNSTTISSNRLKIGESSAGIAYVAGDTERRYTTPQTYNEQTLEKGEYYVVYSTGSGSRWAMVQNFMLSKSADEATGAMLMHPRVTADTTEITVGGSGASLSTVVYDEDNNVVADAAVEYTSSDKSIATVDEDGKVTGIGMGTATITVTATKDGYSSFATIDMTVTEEGAAGIDLTYKFTGSTHAITWKETSPGFAKLTYDVGKDLNQYYANNKNALGHDGNDTQFRGYGHEGFGMGAAVKGNWYAATIRVPVSGKYAASVEVAKYYSGASELGVYLVEKETDLTVEELEGKLTNDTLVGAVNLTESRYKTLVWLDKPENLGVVDLDAGEYYLVLKNTAGSAYTWFGDFFLNGYGNGTAPIITDCIAEKTTFEIDETAAITSNVRYITDGNSAENVTYTYESSAPAVAEVDADGTITAKAAGDATITVTATAENATLPGTRTIDITVNSKEDKVITDAFTTTESAESYTPSVTAYVYKDGAETKLENTETETYITDNGNGTYTLSAPADSDGYKFLYWVKGLSNAKKILGTSREITYRATKDNSLLVAVYENSNDESEARAEFYNANMQLIESNTTFVLPELPVLAGYGKAIAWVSDSMTEYISGTAEVEKSGTTVFVAKYKEAEELPGISITATNATVNNAAPAYGEKVTVTANADTEGNVFQYFTKKGEVVCLDRTYSFSAYESCEVVAVYGVTAPIYTGNRRKIFLDTFDVSGKIGLMAEFIGFDSESVVEKGIMLGTNKIPMTTDKTQFTVIADEEGTYKGYAIVKNGNSYIIITDGEYIK